MNIRKLQRHFLIFSLLFMTGIGFAHSNNFDQLQDGQKAFNLGFHRQAFEIWHVQALAGDPDAQMFIGLAYRNGWGVAKDIEQSLKWYTLSAEQQNTSAQFLLGLALLKSENYDDFSLGINWLQKAAENGDVKASQFLAKARQKNWFPKIDNTQEASPAKSISDPLDIQKPATVSTTSTTSSTSTTSPTPVISSKKLKLSGGQVVSHVVLN